MLNNISSIIQSSNGQCSIIFIFENLCLNEEQDLVVKLLDPVAYQYVWNNKFMRIAECIIGTFRPELTLTLIMYIVNNLSSFIKSREGYFLLRTIVKNSKNPQVQFAFVRNITPIFREFSVLGNGSLLIQCIIHNFALPEFQYIKSCSRDRLTTNHIYNSKDLKITRQENNNALEQIYRVIIEHIYYWESKNLKPLVECCVKVGGKQFERIFAKELPNYLKAFLGINYSVNFVKLISKFFDKQRFQKIVIQINKKIKEFCVESSSLKWKNALAEFMTQSEVDSRFIQSYDQEKQHTQHKIYEERSHLNACTGQNFFSKQSKLISVSSNKFNSPISEYKCSMPEYKVQSLNQVIQYPYYTPQNILYGPVVMSLQNKELSNPYFSLYPNTNLSKYCP